MQHETEWVQRAQAGDQEAFGELVRLHHDRIYGLLMRLTRNPDMAQELEQQTWIKAWRNLPRFRGDSSFSTWVYTIATRNAQDHHRRLKRRGEVEYLEGVDQLPSGSATAQPDRALMHRETGGRILEALDRLGEKHRTVMVLRELEGLSYEEIARVLKCRVGTVMSRLHHARKQIRLQLEGAEA